MKTLYLVRHAKAGSSHSGDFDRMLNETGRKAAHVMGELLDEKGVVPDYVLASPANRALTTAEIFCEILGYPVERIEQRMEIYEGGARRLLSILQQVGDSYNTVLMFGHNPTMTLLVDLLAGCAHEGMATCGVVRLECESDSWGNLRAGSCKLVWYDYPKRHQERG
ncbi:MAG: histidine phosphatase family protein [Chlorobium sp.]|jgi:phosphohistidine phosphatase|nr:histidine phosphatase family protein [Chlorobium sp.]